MFIKAGKQNAINKTTNKHALFIIIARFLLFVLFVFLLVFVLLLLLLLLVNFFLSVDVNIIVPFSLLFKVRSMTMTIDRSIGRDLCVRAYFYDCFT